jgi:hypothetical protein
VASDQIAMALIRVVDLFRPHRRDAGQCIVVAVASRGLQSPRDGGVELFRDRSSRREPPDDHRVVDQQTDPESSGELGAARASEPWQNAS